MTRRQSIKKKQSDPMQRWSIEEADELYGITRWSEGLFRPNAEGHVEMAPAGDAPAIDLHELVGAIRKRGGKLPALIHFTDILRRRIEAMHAAFGAAMKDYGYGGSYRAVYPIKVNQHRHMLEDMVQLGQRHGLGLEVGSKPELLLALAHLRGGAGRVEGAGAGDAPLICNGFKDRDYIELALDARRMGARVYIVVEKPVEIDLIVRAARRLKVQPLLGIRMKLASRGKGAWESSGGDRSKFGLFAAEIVEAIRALRKHRMLEGLRLLHFHIGSQVTDIQRLKRALREATAVFAEACRLGAPIDVLDVGGGLAVDYDGSHTQFASSANYRLPEYAVAVVDAVHTICAEASLPPPTIVTESGRAMAAYHSVLVVEALHASSHGDEPKPPRTKTTAPEPVRWIREAYEGLGPKNFQEIYHDAVEARAEALTLFSLRQISLEDRASVERYFHLICRKILKYTKDLDYVPDELSGLRAFLSTIYYCNFSIFQSLPDHWAVKQLFPVVPLHRLDQRPTVEGILADVTCDSDGVIDRFVDLRDVRDTLPLHPLRAKEPYYLGIFLVGAYQEILGDLHNLFGDPYVIHVSSDDSGYVIDRCQRGDRVRDVLGYVGFSDGEILSYLRAQADGAVAEGRLTLKEATAFVHRVEAALGEHTYLSRELGGLS